MDARRECPQCGEMMRRVERDATDLVPGTGEVKRTRSREWVCPDCDYFEEIEEGSQAGPRNP